MPKFQKTLSDVSSRISLVRTEISQLCLALTELEADSHVDIRSYTSLDIMEAIVVTERVILDRLTDGFDDWKGDDNKDFVALFNSIKSQVIETLERNFSTKQGKTLRFIHSFSTLIVERIIEVALLLGPSGTLSLISPIMAQLTLAVEEHETYDATRVNSANEVLASHRREAPKKKVTLNKDTRLEYIRTMFEQSRDSA